MYTIGNRQIGIDQRTVINVSFNIHSILNAAISSYSDT